MKNLTTASSILLLALCLPATADRIILKDGTILQGKVLKDQGENYTVEVQVTKSIKDERVIAKADVRRIEREQPDLVAFKSVEGLGETPDLLASDDYAVRIRVVEKFLKDYPRSTKAGEARDVLAKLKSEANEILAGGLKMNGKIISPSEYRANAYEFDARVQEAKIRTQISEAHYLAALRMFSSFSQDFRNTAPHAALVPVIVQVINTHLAEVNRLLTTFDARVKEREVGLQRMPSAERGNTENAIREETSAQEAQLKQEKDARVGWVTVYPFLKASLDDTVNFGKQELSRLEALKSANTADGGKAFRDAYNLIQNNGDATVVMNAISAARTAMVPQKYLEILDSAAKANGILK